jgi:hypothetical protein
MDINQGESKMETNDIDIDEASIYPIDVETLQKGQMITPQQVEHITGEIRGTNAYALKAMALAKDIERDRAMMGLPVVARARKLGIYIFPDAEASDYLHSEQKRARAKMGRDLRQQKTAVDRSALNEEQAKWHDHSILCNSRVYQVMRMEERRAPKALAADAAKALEPPAEPAD